MSLVKSCFVLLALTLASGCASSFEATKKTLEPGTPGVNLGGIPQANSPRNNDQEAHATREVVRPHPIDRERVRMNNECWRCR